MSPPSLSWIAAAGVALVMAGGMKVSAEIIDRVMAILPGQIITQSDVEAAIALGLVEPSGGNDRLSAGVSALIDRLLMLAEVRRVVPPEPSESEVEQRAAMIRAHTGSPADYARVLATSGIDDAVVRMHAADDLRLAAYLDERFSAASQPTDQEVLQAGAGSRARLADERRRALLAAWTAELRRRADIVLPAAAP